MKKKDATGSTGTEGLSRKKLLKIQVDLGIFLDKPPADKVLRCINQQFAVYDEDENFVDTIIANERFFIETELTAKITALF